MLNVAVDTPQDLTTIPLGNVVRMNREAFDRIPTWYPSVGVTEPEQPIPLATYYPNGTRSLQFIETWYLPSREYLHRLN